MRIQSVGVVGAGTMGSGIAALAASAGVPVVLLDIPGENGSDQPARRGLERALKARPAAFMSPQREALVRTGTIDRDLELLAGCDLVIEAIIEKPEPKRQLYERLTEVLDDDAIVATNTSGIPIHELAEGRTEGFRQRFLGMHFFNPPRYLHLLELIPTDDTSPEVMRAVERFSERILGKGIVVARDVPGFVANRLGVHGMALALRAMETHDLTIGEVDALTGPLIGRPKSAIFRTADITGLDVLSHVAKGLGEATGEDFSLPGWVAKLVAEGKLGEKSGTGFYQKEGKEIRTLDWKTGEYAVTAPTLPDEATALARQPLPARLRSVLALPGKYGAFMREVMLGSFHYVLEHAADLAYDLTSVDQALEWGYGWEMGPFRQMDAIGLDAVRAAFAERGLDEPRLLREAGDRFIARDEDGTERTLAVTGGQRISVSRQASHVTAADLRAGGNVVEETRDAALLDMGDGVLLFESRSKMNTLGQGVVQQLAKALDTVERGDYAGLVIGNDDTRAFSAGADLMMVAGAAQQGDWAGLERSIRGFQEMSMRLRQSPFPVVAAPFGLTLGGGCEFSLHCDRVQAHAELYMGLVEVGVGLIPGGGGTKELLFRFMKDLEPYEEADPFEAVKRAFQLIATAVTSTSALDARERGFLRREDRISMSRDLLLADAKRRVLDLATDYVAPAPMTVMALGKQAMGNLEYALWAFREAGQASEHDVRIGHHVAYVLAGGDAAPRIVTEQDILDLEREAFLTLLGVRETQDRIAHMLKTGKPLRN